MRRIWPFTLNVLTSAGLAFLAPFVVLYYQSLGFTGTQIGLLVGLSPLIMLFGAPLWTGVADATQRHRLIMSLALLVTAIAIFLLPFANTFAPIMLVAVLFYIFYAPTPSLADSATMFMLGDEKEMYGRIRLGGTIGYGLAAAIAGVVVQSHGLKLAFWGGAALFFLGFIVSQKLVHGQSRGNASVGGGVRTLLTSRRWILFLAVAFAGGLALAATNNYLFPYMRELGAHETAMGFALTIGMVSEIPVLFFGNRLLQRFKSYGLLMLAMTITGVRLLAFAASRSPILVLLLQLPGGLTFPAMWMAGVSYANENAPVGMSATAQGLFGAMVFGFGSAVGGLSGALLLESLGGRGMYLVFGLVVLATLAITALIGGRLDAKRQALPSNL